MQIKIDFLNWFAMKRNNYGAISSLQSCSRYKEEKNLYSVVRGYTQCKQFAIWDVFVAILPSVNSGTILIDVPARCSTYSTRWLIHLFLLACNRFFCQRSSNISSTHWKISKLRKVKCGHDFFFLNCLSRSYRNSDSLDLEQILQCLSGSIWILLSRMSRCCCQKIKFMDRFKQYLNL